MSDEIIAVIDALAERLSVPVDMLMDTLTKQAKVYFISTLICPIITLFFFILALYFQRKKKEFQKIIHDRDYPTYSSFYSICEKKEIYSGVCLAIAILFLLFSLLDSYNAITALMNPAYWALKEIMGGLK